ncbi:hypothetical protein EBT31_03925 [bacterium]|nr:hypothetical protein [bacterium]
MADRIDFHFNKASIGDPAIPPWVVKSKGVTHYIWHFESDIGFTTRETPEHPSTKGSIRLLGTLELQEINGRTCAHIRS